MEFAYRECRLHTSKRLAAIADCGLSCGSIYIYIKYIYIYREKPLQGAWPWDKACSKQTRSSTLVVCCRLTFGPACEQCNALPRGGEGQGGEGGYAGTKLNSLTQDLSPSSCRGQESGNASLLGKGDSLFDSAGLSGAHRNYIFGGLSKYV